MARLQMSSELGWQNSLPALAVFILITAVAAVLGARYMPGPWYEALAKPSWTPPNWLFGPAWTILYIMIAVAGWRAWRAGGISPALTFWALNIIANALWSYIMFGQRNIGLALIDASAMWLTIVGFIALSWNLDRTAALLFVPYLAWVSFATALNFSIWRMNG